jgi:hypothetical protein
MKCFALLCLCVYLLGCSATHLDPAATNLNKTTSSSTSSSSSSSSSFSSGSSSSGSGSSSSGSGGSGSSTSNTYDMLKWMTMDPQLRASHHMAGTANPIYTRVLSDRFFWTKTAQGFPWDVQLYDGNYIYLWVTELDWSNPSTFKVFRSPTLGNYNLPLVPRFAQGGYPGSKIRISDSTYEIHSSCSSYITKSLGHVINEVWGPYNESLGGSLPDNLETLVISYRYSCDSSYSHCGDKETSVTAIKRYLCTPGQQNIFKPRSRRTDHRRNHLFLNDSSEVAVKSQQPGSSESRW